MIVGARPNFIKAAPVYEKLKQNNFDVELVHTGQHYTSIMSKDIFDDLKVYPDVYFESNTSDRWTLINEIRNYLSLSKPDLVMVFGDVNTTFAGAWAAKTLGIKIAHVESGLRSNDWRMPEEMNRYYVDSISDILFTTCQSSNNNLYDEFRHPNIVWVGNTMIDTLEKFREQIVTSTSNAGLYVVATLHRPENIDNPDNLEKIMCYLLDFNKTIKIYLVCHPRLQKELDNLDIVFPSDMLLQPMSYLNFLKFVYHSQFVITDSGGLQEECAMMWKPCITFRKSTERPITLSHGNKLATTFEELEDFFNLYYYEAHSKIFPNINTWNFDLAKTTWGDGNASQRIVDYIKRSCV